MIAYADDVYLQGSREQVIAAYRELVELSSNIGLLVQPAKCEVSGSEHLVKNELLEACQQTHKLLALLIDVAD